MVSRYIENGDAMEVFGKRLGMAVKEIGTTHKKEGLTVFLTGVLGAGKTTLSRGFLRAFGHRGAVKSPTYTLVEPYIFSTHNVYHFDLYRLGDPEELEFMGVRDYFCDGNICLLEWPDRGKGFLPEEDMTVKVRVKAPGRMVDLRAQTGLGEAVLTRLSANHV